MLKLKLPADINNLERFQELVRQLAEKSGFPSKKVKQIELALEEALTNVFNYAYPPASKGHAEVLCWEEGENLVIEIHDWGEPFNPLEVPDPDLESDVTTRSIGGLGIYMIRKLVDDISYRRDGDMNVLSLVIRKDK